MFSKKEEEELTKIILTDNRQFNNYHPILKQLNFQLTDPG
jgi:hypothetical protein